jgi:hypothetical protein
MGRWIRTPRVGPACRVASSGLFPVLVLASSLLLAACAPGEEAATDTPPVTPPSSPAVANAAPTISGAPGVSEVVAGDPFSFTPQAADADNDPLTFSVQAKPAWMSFDPATGTLSGTPADADVATYTGIVVSVSDGKATTNGVAWNLTVKARAVSTPPPPANVAPTISGTPPTTASTGVAYAFQPAASDANGDRLTFSISNKPAWATFNTATGALTGTPTAAGTFANIVIAVTDGSATVSLPAFTITVAQANRAPTISGVPASSARVGQAYSFTPSASDPDGNALAFSVQNKPAWATFNGSTGRLSGTPPTGSEGTYSNVVITVSDGALRTSLPAFTITVTATNQAPTIGGTPTASVNAGSAYSFKPTASDPEGATLTFSISNKPAWATFDTATGTLSGTPAAGDVGTYSNVSISVSDGQLSASLAAFTITVKGAVTGAAILSWQPPTQRADGTTLTDLAGYRIYYGTTRGGSYPQRIELANPGLTTYVVENLGAGTWYFVTTAYDAAGNESGYSTEASKTIQ